MIALTGHVPVVDITCRVHQRQIGQVRMWADDEGVTYDDSPVFVLCDVVDRRRSAARRTSSPWLDPAEDYYAVCWYFDEIPPGGGLGTHVRLIQTTKLHAHCRRCGESRSVDVAALLAAVASWRRGKGRSRPKVRV